ncbi:phage integrase N-terminal SAM-like domain-containing protein [Metallibacterium scheffleri]
MVYAGESGGVPDHQPQQQPRLLAEVRRRLRLKDYSLRTKQAYMAWIRRVILFYGKHHPREMGGDEVERFLSDRARASR